jgi:hypothetical protein
LFEWKPARRAMEEYDEYPEDIFLFIKKKKKDKNTSQI